MCSAATTRTTFLRTPYTPQRAQRPTPGGIRDARRDEKAVGRRVQLLSLATVLLCSPAQVAEALPLFFDVDVTGMIEANREKARAAEEQFEKSDFLRELKQRSNENRLKNKRAIEAKYCLRQAELGIGDCGDLKEIPEVLEELRKTQD